MPDTTTLRAEQASHVPSCAACDDTGWIERVCCDEERCGRPRCAYHVSRWYKHTYVVPCDQCKAGARRQIAVTRWRR